MARLRNYQQKLLERTVSCSEPAKARVMLQLPTGGGKTHIAGALLQGRLHNGCKAVWLTHRRELAEQTRRMLTEAGISAIDLTWPLGEDAPFISNGVVILMAQTVGRRTNRMQIWGEYNSGDLLVIDEAHHATAAGWERAIGQWPGRVVGLTATPWRLSRVEGFSHLFKELLCGPQVGELQADGWLCRTRVLVPRPEEVILGGVINSVGEYSEGGIEQANRDRPDVMTAGALRYWKLHANERQTIVYAVSQDHARNLADLFNDAGIPARVMLGDTPAQERASVIEAFGNGTLRVLVNVAVATEGFDLPDASCVAITRPTKSLALYLQMVGRGMRPKANGEECLILDLAGNSENHGLPEDDRRWTLSARDNDVGGKGPVVRCEKCDAVSPSASHMCVFCNYPFGKDCLRCGTWRAWERWQYEQQCGSQHDLVCDLCHYDAHIQSELPVTGNLRRLSMTELNLETVLQNLLEEEALRAGNADKERTTELRSLIATAEETLIDKESLLQSFENHTASLPEEDRPESKVDEYRLFHEWEEGLKQKLAGWEEELVRLESKAPDTQLIYNNARGRVLLALDAQATAFGLFPQTQRPRNTRKKAQVSTSTSLVSLEGREWMNLAELGEWGRIEPTKGTEIRPACFKDPQGREYSVGTWSDLFFNTARWLVEAGLLTEPFTFGTMTKRRLIHSEPIHPNGREFGWSRKLPNGLFLECKWGSKAIARQSGQLLVEFDQDPAQFHVQLS